MGVVSILGSFWAAMLDLMVPRLKVTLIPRAQEAAQAAMRLTGLKMRLTGLNKTDVINRALPGVRVHRVADSRGAQVSVRAQDSKTSLVKFL